MASWCDEGRNKRSALNEDGGKLSRQNPSSLNALLTLARRDATEPAPRLEAPRDRASARASRQANVNQRRSKVKRMVIVVVIALAWIGGGWTWDDRYVPGGIEQIR